MTRILWLLLCLEKMVEVIEQAKHTHDHLSTPNENLEVYTLEATPSRLVHSSVDDSRANRDASINDALN